MLAAPALGRACDAIPDERGLRRLLAAGWLTLAVMCAPRSQPPLSLC